MAEENVPFHDLVKQIVDDMQAEKGGPVLPREAFDQWTTRLRGHAEAVTVATQLVALAIRFRRERAERTALQLTLLAVVAADAAWVRAAFEKGGVASDEARKLVKEAAGAVAKTVAGLEPPKGGGAKGIG